LGAAALTYAKGSAWALSPDGKQAAAVGAPFGKSVGQFITVMRVGNEPFSAGSMQVLHNIQVVPTLCDVHVIRCGLLYYFALSMPATLCNISGHLGFSQLS
jgi:hypothetical protein